ncbi:MAG: hypothetical protein FD159_490 [Syntrophaceae bacterium]|nr:MAG: hypothetical protein FD159_490 [Syntrophaceae bacterium]
MTYSKYAEMALRYGIKPNIPITAEVLDKLKEQSEIFDLIWGSQAAISNNSSPAILSISTMAEIRRLNDLLLTHPAFNKEKYKNSRNEIEKRADKHYSVDVRHSLKRFTERQEKIRIKLGLSNTGNTKMTKEHKESESPDSEIPSRNEVEAAMRNIGKQVHEDILKETLNAVFTNQGRKLRKDWWEVTKKNLEEWSKKG